MRIVTGWAGNYWEDSRVRKRCIECIDSWLYCYPDLSVELWTTLECYQRMRELGVPDWEGRLGVFIVPSEGLEDYFYDWIRFRALTLQKERCMWIDPDYKTLKPYPQEILDDVGTVYLQEDWIDPKFLLYNKSLVEASLPRDELLRYNLRYENEVLHPIHNIRYGVLIFDELSGYVFGTEVLKLMHTTLEVHKRNNKPFMSHASITENFAAAVLDAFHIKVKCLDHCFDSTEYVSFVEFK